MKRIRIGRINYTNVWPVFHHLSTAWEDAEVDWISEVPAGVNRAMASGLIDIAAVSSFAYAEHADDYLLLPNLSVSAYGAVNSIFLFHERPLTELGDARIALTNASATSVHLLKIVMNKLYGYTPEYVEAAPVLEEMMREADAALLIGDDAIRASWRNRADRRYYMTDLGQLWQTLTDQWMTFAVWVVRREAAARMPELVERVYKAFCQSKEMSMAEPDRVARAASEKIGGDESYWRHYFSNLCYEFGPPQQAGLSLYFQYAYELGLLDRRVELHMWKSEQARDHSRSTSDTRVNQ